MKLFLSLGIMLFVACQSSLHKKNKAAEEQPAFTTEMQELKRNLNTLQPYIFNSALFNDDDNKHFLAEKIHQLATSSANVKHDVRMTHSDPTLKFVATEFADELSRADKNFQDGWREYSRTQLVKVTSYCLECHVRLPQGPSFARNESEEVFTHKLPPSERIQLMLSFRQFEAAYKLVLENLSESKKEKSVNYKADHIARLGLMAAIQYMNDYNKAKKIIDVIESNPTLPDYLKRNNKFWAKSLERWPKMNNLNNLKQIRQLITSRISEVDDMRAIGALLYLLNTSLNKNELGEALLLTGQSYEELNKVSLMSLHENYYETCVRQAPATKWAKTCLAKYTDSIVMGYSGSSGTRIPKDVRARLEELRKIIKTKN